MDKRPLLIVECVDLSSDESISSIISQACHILITLKSESLVILVRNERLRDPTANRVALWTQVEYLLYSIYTATSAYAFKLSKNPLEPSVLVLLDDGRDRDLGDIDIIYTGENQVPNWLSKRYSLPLSCPGTSLQNIKLPQKPDNLNSWELDASLTLKQSYETVVLGGTFDHLHAGQIHLSMAGWLSTKKLIVGVSDGPMLDRKKFKEQMESYPTRETNVKRFMSLFAPHLEHQVIPIQDPFGPTITEPNLDAMALSLETLDGGRQGRYFILIQN